MLCSLSQLGCLERLLGAQFRFPGMWCIVKRYRRVFSLRFRRQLFGMLSRDLLVNIPRSGLSSSAMMKFSQPSTKCLALSKASATARVSSLIGAYQDSSECVNRIPACTTFQPVWQQNGLMSLHEQCFWNNQKPIPILDQSVARHVGLLLSNMRTPSLISLMISRFDTSKICCSSSSQ